MPDEKTPDRPIEKSAVYFNGFGMGIGTSDISIQLHLDNEPVVELKASYTTVKTFALALMATVQRFEQITSHNILTINDISDSMRKETKEEATVKASGS